MTADRQAPAPPRPTFGTLPASNLRTIPIRRLCSTRSAMRSRRRVPPSLVLLLLAPPLAAQARGPAAQVRSEEHTSELQSLAYLVCRLLLEKKKTQRPPLRRPSTTASPTRTPASTRTP